MLFLHGRRLIKSLCPELRFLWHHKNNLSVDANGVIWRRRSSNSHQLQLLIPKAARQELFLAYHVRCLGTLGLNQDVSPAESSLLLVGYV